jgi:hypothetical protein
MKIKPKLHSKLEPKSRDPYIRRSDAEMIKRSLCESEAVPYSSNFQLNYSSEFKILIV